MLRSNLLKITILYYKSHKDFLFHLKKNTKNSVDQNKNTLAEILEISNDQISKKYSFTILYFS